MGRALVLLRASVKVAGSFTATTKKGTCVEVPFPVFELARPKRFELLTPWFVARYSIQLSYGRVRA